MFQKVKGDSGPLPAKPLQQTPLIVSSKEIGLGFLGHFLSNPLTPDKEEVRSALRGVSPAAPGAAGRPAKCHCSAWNKLVTNGGVSAILIEHCLRILQI